MQPLQTTEGIVLAGNIDDLKDLIVEKCGYEVYDFIKREESGEIADLKDKLDNEEYLKDEMETLKDYEESQRKEVVAELKEAEERIKALEKELKLLKPNPVIIPIESLKKPVDLDDLDDEECIPF